MTDKVDVIIEFSKPQRHAFEKYALAVASVDDRNREAESLMDVLSGYNCELHEHSLPIPMVSGPKETNKSSWQRLSRFSSQGLSPDISSTTMTMEVSIPKKNIAKLQAKSGIIVWPSSPIKFFPTKKPVFPKPDCQYTSIATIEEIWELLRIDALFSAKLDGKGVVVAVVDEGIDGKTYKVAGGYDGPNSISPGTAALQSHGSMCAADILVCAPKVQLLDYPMLDASSGSGLRMFQHMLNLKRTTGTPHLANNSYGYVSVPPKSTNPRHEVHDLNHPFHRKVREVIAAGVSCFFAAGNCGEDCPSGNCEISSIGPGKSIHGTNSIEEVITIAAVNKLGKRIGYSSQGPGMFVAEKPDIASYSHFYAHLGPGRPAGGKANVFDNGTSAATPLAVGVAALLVQAFPDISPKDLKSALLYSARRSGAASWNREYGHGIIDAFSAWTYLLNGQATA